MAYIRCSRCVMDNASDPNITFDAQGRCNYCCEAETALSKNYHPDGKQFDALCERLKEEGKGKEFDCLMGVSGGLDSSYLLMLAAKKGVRIMALHVDDGFDTPLAKRNIENLCRTAGVRLEVIAPDAGQFNDLTAAYMRAGVCNLASPQDNVLFACLYRFALQKKLKYFLSGGNLALESILERSATYTCFDTVNLKDIHRRFGKKPLKGLPLISHAQISLISRVCGIRTLKPLDLIDYNRDRAIAELKEYCGYEYYRAKHLENTLTSFIQTYWFYHKFGIDKRKSHYSSMIMSGQMDRSTALELLKSPPYDEKEMQGTISQILSAIGMSREEFDAIMAAPARSHYDYKTSFLYNTLRTIKHKGRK